MDKGIKMPRRRQPARAQRKIHIFIVIQRREKVNARFKQI